MPSRLRRPGPRLRRQGRLLLLRQPVELGPALLLRGRFQLTAGGHDVAAAGAADRGGDAGFEDDVGETPDASLVGTFVGRAGPWVERDQVDLGGELVLADQTDQLAGVLVAVIL